jgi:hypothetical protein
METGLQQFGKWLIAIGVFIIITGGVLILLGKTGLFKLPGDLEFGSKNWRIYIPLASCMILSVVLTIIFWLINYFRR